MPEDLLRSIGVLALEFARLENAVANQVAACFPDFEFSRLASKPLSGLIAVARQLLTAAGSPTETLDEIERLSYLRGHLLHASASILNPVDDEWRGLHIGRMGVGRASRVHEIDEAAEDVRIATNLLMYELFDISGEKLR